MSTLPTVLTVVGARPQFVKAAVISAELARLGNNAPYKEILLHTGQHYDANMSEIFFRELNIRKEDVNLNVGSNSAGKQLGEILAGLEQTIRDYEPNAVMAYGDTHSTLAAAIMAAHTNTPFIHVEAGERLYRRHQIPEEVNRIVSDNVAHLCLASTPAAFQYLKNEKFDPSRIKFVGDPMYELFLIGTKKLKDEPVTTLEKYNLEENQYHLATIHRAENTASKEILLGILSALDKSDKTVVLPIHPRVKNLLESWSWKPSGNLKIIDAQGYFDFLALLHGSHRVVTDSGGVSREAFFANKPSIIPLDDTHWLEIEKAGWSIVVGRDNEAITKNLNHLDPPSDALEGLFGDGKAGEKIVKAIGEFLHQTDLREASWSPVS